MTDLAATASAHFAPDASIEAIADFIAGMLAGGKPRAIAVPGGSTPGPILAALAEREDIGWVDVAVWLTDDRCVPTDHAASNFGLLERSLAASRAVPNSGPAERLRAGRGARGRRTGIRAPVSDLPARARPHTSVPAAYAAQYDHEAPRGPDAARLTRVRATTAQ